MYAIIEESGGQRKVTEGEEILIDLHGHGQTAAGATVTFDRVLVIGADDAGSSKIGAPYVGGARVEAEVVDPMLKGEKVHIFKFRPKKGYKRKTGHRQQYTRVRVTKIVG